MLITDAQRWTARLGSLMSSEIRYGIKATQSYIVIKTMIWNDTDPVRVNYSYDFFDKHSKQRLKKLPSPIFVADRIRQSTQ